MATPVPARAVPVRAFACALYVLPPAFRREFGAEMTADFTESLHDIDVRGATLALWLRAFGDLCVSAPRLWIDTGLPLIAAAAAAWALVVATAAARLPPAAIPLPDQGDDRDLRLLILLVAVVLVVIANTLIVSLWFLRPILTRHRTLTPCSKRGA